MNAVSVIARQLPIRCELWRFSKASATPSPGIRLLAAPAKGPLSHQRDQRRAPMPGYLPGAHVAIPAVRFVLHSRTDREVIHEAAGISYCFERRGVHLPDRCRRAAVPENFPDWDSHASPK